MPYVVASPFSYLGRAYAAGEAFEPKQHLIGQLVASGCIKEVPPPVPTVEVEKPAAKPLPRSRVSLGD